MDIDEYIAFCNTRISQCWQLIQGLERDGIPPESAAYDILAEKAEFWINRLEAVGQVDPANGFLPEVTDIIWN